MITFQKENLYPFVFEGLELFEKHYNEIAERTDVIKLDPDLESYERLEEANKLEVHTIRDDGVLIGYHLWFVVNHLHYKNSITASSDILFIHPDHRKGLVGIRFIRWTVEEVKKRNPQRIMFHVKNIVDYSPIIKRMGAKHFESVYTIVME